MYSLTDMQGYSEDPPMLGTQRLYMWASGASGVSNWPVCLSLDWCQWCFKLSVCLWIVGHRARKPDRSGEEEPEKSLLLPRGQKPRRWRGWRWLVQCLNYMVVKRGRAVEMFRCYHGSVLCCSSPMEPLSRGWNQANKHFLNVLKV